MSSPSTIALMERYAATVGRDWDALASCSAEDAVFEAPNRAGRIIRFVEYLNSVAVIRAVMPGGLVVS